ncbi:helix-turn-helix domain-containing protein [Haloechinothrix sp. YIM 98757]|uniref:Helix-turn-helix domain-containing protein n=1 Tax=Haloechinothrix aidingensis TaxID=2752311 RepID=A0A838AB46_9PSEU|nr:helix-turn-helix domain-containing protein [Haloechinothrix aidingensis]
MGAFLRLLAREAQAVEFERPVLDARLQGASEEVLDELERAKDLALQVRGLLERRRRSEAELSALFDTVADLATLRDLDAVLEAIVRRARKLLDTDVTYMTLNDEERADTYMRVTDGSVSARFQQLRLDMGAGLGGLVAQTAIPYATANYMADDRFRHEGEIDDAVAEEGIVAILGVPLRLGPRVLGVLFAANRSARPFEREEVALLGSLAAHAAVAIDNARLLAETRSALEELSAANAVIREHSTSVERAAEAHDRMAELVLRGGDVTDLAESVAGIVGGELMVLDSDGRRLAAVGTIEQVDAEQLSAAMASARSLGRTVRRGDLWVTAVGAGSEHLCGLLLRADHELSETDQRILERAAVVTALLLLFRRSVMEAEIRVRGELLEDLVSKAAEEPETVRERARRLDMDLDRQHVILVARCQDQLRQRLAFHAASQASTRGGLAAQRDGACVLLLPGEEAGALARELARDFGAALGEPVTIGAGGPASGPESLAETYREASRCASALLALDRVGDGAGVEDLGFVGLLLSSERDVNQFVQRTLGPLIDYDSRRNTALLRTLDAYFRCAGSPTKAAEHVHVHVNTVNQRLERIGQLLGEDWMRPERSLELQLALHLRRLGSRV